MGAVHKDKGKGKEHIPLPHPFFAHRMSVGPSTSGTIINTPTPPVASNLSLAQASTVRVGPYSIPTRGSSTDPESQESQKSSWVWEHGFELPGLWQCAYCSQKYSDKGTSNQQRHLREVHQTHRPNAIKTSLPQSNLYTPQRCETIRLRELLVEWIVDRRHPFVEVESSAFRNFVEYLNPLAVNKVPKSANTVRADIVKCFQVAKKTINQSLQTSKSKIHLTFDLWSSPNYKSIIAIVGHWTNSEGKVETATLALREILGGHRGAEDLAPVIHEVVKEYGIQNKLGWFMTDNAGNNDTASIGIRSS
jgi:BED zinc finger